MSTFRCAFELDAGDRTFASGLLPELAQTLRSTPPGDLFGVTSNGDTLASDLEAWSRLTGNAIVDRSEEAGVVRWIIRHGPAPSQAEEQRSIGSRVWLYTNFDCNLACDYCCVRSSPTARRRELGLERVRRIAREAPPLGTESFFVTGGEPFVLPDVVEILRACAEAAPTTVLTNGMLLRGARLEALGSLPRDRVTLQISVDSPTPALHDLHRGKGSWEKAWRGVETARSVGFRVRLAATVERAEDEHAFTEFLDRQGVALRDRVIRRVAHRGLAERGVALAKSDLVPEITITADGVYWHPVGAEDRDLLVTTDIFPLAQSFDAVRGAFGREQAFASRLATVFHCA